MHFYKECFIPIIFGHYECFYEALSHTKKSLIKRHLSGRNFSSFSSTSLLAIIIKKTAYFPLQHISKHTVTLLDAKLILNYYIDIAPKRCITLQNVLCTCTFYVNTLYSTLHVQKKSS